MRVVVPVYNEEKTIAQLLEKLKEYGVTVVANGCTDRTVEIAKKFKNAEVIEFGEALGSREPIRKSLDKINDDILIVDADLEVSPSELKKFPPYTEEYDVILGQRDLVPRRSEKFCAEVFGIPDIFCTPVFYKKWVLEEYGLGYLTPYFAKLGGAEIRRVQVSYMLRKTAKLDDAKIYEQVILELAEFLRGRESKSNLHKI